MCSHTQPIKLILINKITFGHKLEERHAFLHNVGVPPVRVLLWLRRQDSGSCEIKKVRSNIYFWTNVERLLVLIKIPIV